jgi:site-specific DNA-methyltransferase (adenine-specific)
LTAPKVELYLGDCLEIMVDLAPPVDAVIADLPYGMTANKWDSILPLPQLWAHYLKAAKPSATFIFTASQPFTSALVMSQPELFRHEWIWIKNRGSNFANTVREPFKEHESVLVFSRGKWTYNRQMQERTGAGGDRVKYGVAFRSQSENYREFEGKDHQNVPRLRVPSSWQKFNTEVGCHPTQKPVALMKYLIETYTNPGDTILDNTMGSGTAGVACVETSRNFVGIEIRPDYFKTAQKRINAAIAASQSMLTLV